jgi:hypothetical protein
MVGTAGMVEIEKSIEKTDKIRFDFDSISIRYDSIRYEIWKSRNDTEKNYSIWIYFSSCFEKNQYYIEILSEMIFQ